MTKMTAAEMKARIKELEAALKPFASVAEFMRPLGAFETWPDDKPNHSFTPGDWPNWGDFKRAAEAIKPRKSPEIGIER